jgi:hypothetical protein
VICLKFGAWNFHDLNKPTSLFISNNCLFKWLGPACTLTSVASCDTPILRMVYRRRSRVKRFRVQGSILVPLPAFGMRIDEKSVSFSGLIQNLEAKWQLLGELTVFNEGFSSLMVSLSLFKGPIMKMMERIPLEAGHKYSIVNIQFGSGFAGLGLIVFSRRRGKFANGRKTDMSRVGTR